MNMYKSLEKDPKAALIEQLGKLRAGMLGIEGSGQHLRPMTHFPDWEKNQIWFVTSRRTDLVETLRPDAVAHFSVMEGERFQACLRGPISVVNSPAKLDELWSPVVGAWFEGGKDDPDITLLRLDLKDAAIWGASENALKFGFEIARANLEDTRLPDIGTHKLLTF